MPTLAQFGPFAIDPEQIRDKTLQDIYDASGTEQKEQIRNATGLTRSTAYNFIQNPHHYSLDDQYDFARALGWSYEDILLPLAINAMHRERKAFGVPSPGIHSRMVVNPVIEEEEEEEEESEEGRPIEVVMASGAALISLAKEMVKDCVTSAVADGVSKGMVVVCERVGDKVEMSVGFITDPCSIEAALELFEEEEEEEEEEELEENPTRTGKATTNGAMDAVGVEVARAITHQQLSGKDTYVLFLMSKRGAYIGNGCNPEAAEKVKHLIVSRGVSIETVDDINGNDISNEDSTGHGPSEILRAMDVLKNMFAQNVDTSGAFEASTEEDGAVNDQANAQMEKVFKEVEKLAKARKAIDNDIDTMIVKSVLSEQASAFVIQIEHANPRIEISTKYVTNQVKLAVLANVKGDEK